jgi:DNA-binding XRE family transcriptional regulator
MSDQTGVSFRTIGEIETATGIRSSTLTRLRTLRFEPPNDSALIDATGTRRRLASLWYDGFPIPWLQERLGVLDRRHTQILIRGGKAVGRPSLVKGVTAAAVNRLYDELDGHGPEEFGIAPRVVKFCRTFAVKVGATPRHCWDPDTIDDPEAIPEWTGACGTSRGLHIHYRDQILPACGPCLATRTVETPHAGSSTSGLQGPKLTTAREKRGLSIRELGVELGVSESTVYYWETGRSAPRSRERLTQLCKTLGCMETDLTGETA